MTILDAKVVVTKERRRSRTFLPCRWIRRRSKKHLILELTPVGPRPPGVGLGQVLPVGLLIVGSKSSLYRRYGGQHTFVHDAAPLAPTADINDFVNRRIWIISVTCEIVFQPTPPRHLGSVVQVARLQCSRKRLFFSGRCTDNDANETHAVRDSKVSSNSGVVRDQKVGRFFPQSIECQNRLTARSKFFTMTKLHTRRLVG